MGATIAVLITCYNRCQSTLACLSALYGSAQPHEAELRTYLVDDGSTDGTSEVVRQQYPEVKVIQGTGALYWCGGMRLAWEHALTSRHDYFLWLNDDTELLEGAIDRLLHCSDEAAHRYGCESIIVGSCQDPDSKQHTYGGRVRRNGRVRLADCPLPPTDDLVRCDTMNGNIVLVPRTVMDRIGILSAEYTHFIGDVDYGLRATEAGIPVIVAPGYLGECRRNSDMRPWADPRIPLAQRLRHLLGPKGLQPRAWCHYVRRHTGLLWPIYFLKPIVRALAPSIASGFRRRK